MPIRSNHHRRGVVSLLFIIVLCIAIMTVTTATFMLAMKAKTSSYTILARSEATDRQLSANRASLLAFSSYIQKAMEGSSAVTIDAALTDVLNATNNANWLAGGSHNNSVLLGSAQVRVQAESDSTDPASDIKGSLTQQYQTIKCNNDRFKIGNSNGEFLGKRWTYLLESSFEQKYRLDNSDNNMLTRANTALRSRITVFEFPSQFAVQGALLDINSQIDGSVLAGNANIGAGTNVEGLLTALHSPNLQAGANIGGVSAKGGDFIPEEYKHDSGQPFDGQISALDTQGTALLIPPGRDAEGNEVNIFGNPGSPNNWDIYTLPVYQTDLRLSLAIGGDGTIISSQIIQSNGTPTADFAERTSQSFLAADYLNGWVSSSLIGAIPTVNINLEKAPVINGRRSIYVSVINNDSAQIRLYNGAEINTPTSVVSSNTVLIASELNKLKKPFSIIAPHVVFGEAGANFTKFSGNVAMVDTSSKNTTGYNPAQFEVGQRNNLATPSEGIELYNIDPTDPNSLPPAYLKNWLIYVEALP